MKKLLGVFLMITFCILSCKENVNKTNFDRQKIQIENSANIITAEYKIDNNVQAYNVSSENEKILVIYFSKTGNTKSIAEYIQSVTGADIFEIVTVNPYPENYRQTTDQAKKELNDNYLPALKDGVKNLSSYDNIILGYPIWWGTIPQAVKKFIIDNNFEGKTIAPFCTHGGSGLSSSVQNIRQAAKNATVLDGLAIRGSQTESSNNEVDAWLKKISIETK